MDRKIFSSDEIADIVMKLNGEVEPVGSSEVDEKRYINMIRLQDIVDILIDEIQLQLPYRNRIEYSMRKIGLQAATWGERKTENFQELF